MATNPPGYMREFRAMLKARGLCIDCTGISEKYLRCLCCRAKAQARRKKARSRVRSTDNRVTMAA